MPYPTTARRFGLSAQVFLFPQEPGSEITHVTTAQTETHPASQQHESEPESGAHRDQVCSPLALPRAWQH